MSVLTLEREEAPDWVRLPLQDSKEILLISQEGVQLALPATVLLAVSRSLATILDTNLLSVATPSVSLPVGLECLKAFKEFLLFGRVVLDQVDEKENVEELFYLLDIEASMSTSVMTTGHHCEVGDPFSVAYNADSQFIQGVDVSGTNKCSPPPSPSQFLDEEESIENARVAEIGLSNDKNEVEDQNRDENPAKVLRRSSRKTRLRLQNICEKLSGRVNVSPTDKRFRGAARIPSLPGPRGRSVRHLLHGRGGQNERDYEKTKKDSSKENLNDINEEFRGFSQSEVHSMLEVQKGYRDLLRPCRRRTRKPEGGMSDLRERNIARKDTLQGTEHIKDDASEVGPMLDVQGGYQSILRRSTKSPSPPRAEVEPRFESANEDVDVIDGPSQPPPIAEIPRVFSNNKKDFCKVECKICGGVKQVSSMYYHVTRAHKMRIQDYNSKHGRYTARNLLTTTVYHRCGVCNMELLFDSQSISNHVIKKHNMGVAAYSKQFLDVD